MVEIIIQYMQSDDWVPDQTFSTQIQESCLLPLIENAFRTGSLLDMFKHYDLYKSYIMLVREFSQRKELAHLLMEIEKAYEPI